MFLVTRGQDCPNTVTSSGNRRIHRSCQNRSGSAALSTCNASLALCWMNCITVQRPLAGCFWWIGCNSLRETDRSSSCIMWYCLLIWANHVNTLYSKGKEHIWSEKLMMLLHSDVLVVELLMLYKLKWIPWFIQPIFYSTPLFFETTHWDPRNPQSPYIRSSFPGTTSVVGVRCRCQAFVV